MSARPTPETNAYLGTHETHRINGRTIYEHAQSLERGRDEGNETIASLAHIITGKCPKHGTVTVFGHLKRTGYEEWHCPVCEEIEAIKNEFALQLSEKLEPYNEAVKQLHDLGLVPLEDARALADEVSAIARQKLSSEMEGEEADSDDFTQGAASPNQRFTTSA